MSEPSSAASPALEDRAVALAQRWAAGAADVETAGVEADPAAERLAGMLRDADGLPFALGVADGVLRPESLTAAASQLRRVAPNAPDVLPWLLRSAVRLGGGLAPVLPAPVVPLARRALRELLAPLAIDARPAKLGPAIERVRATGARPDLTLLGEPVLGEEGARRRLDGIHELIRRPDVDHVSVTVSAVAGRRSAWAFDEGVDDIVARLLPLYLSAASHGTVITLDVPEYRDLDLTVAVFTRILEDPRLAGLGAGIELPAHLPDALPVLQELTAWSRERVEHGGAAITVRVAAGAGPAQERAESRIRGWATASYNTVLDADANLLRCIEWALRAENAAAVRLGLAGVDLFAIAYAWLVAEERAVREQLEVALPHGCAPGLVQAVSGEVGTVLLCAPVVAPSDVDVTLAPLVRRLEAQPADGTAADPGRFLAALRRSTEPTLATGPRRTQDRRAPVHESVRPVPPAPEPEQGLTRAVLGIARGGDAAADPFWETAVYSAREVEADGGGAPGFTNAPDSDPSLPANRAWAREIADRMPRSTDGADAIAAARVDDETELARRVERVRAAAPGWGARPAAERSSVLLRAAVALEARRGRLIETVGSEAGCVFSEADSEVSRAVDLARYYAATARELDAIAGATFEPARVVVVAPQDGSPVATAADGVLAALAAGSGVVLTPAPYARRCAAVMCEALWEAGVPREALTIVDLADADLVQRLVTDEAVDRVVLTGAWETAALFRSWRPDLTLHADTAGRNAMIVTPSADLDLAVTDLVRSAFARAGQDASAASLAILVGSVGRSARFARQLADAVGSLHVSWPADLGAEVGPMIERPNEAGVRALTELDGDERWLVEPRRVDESGRLWSPGIRVGVRPGSRFHLEHVAAPVLGIMHAPTLDKAVELQNAVESGRAAGLQTYDPADLALWLDQVQAGALFVNRAMTGAIVQRQPIGGWKRSSVGTGATAGGPNRLVTLGAWRSRHSGAVSSTLHLRGLDSRITLLIEAAQPSLDYESFEWLRRSALSDALAWDREFGRVRDVTHLGVERNLFRYRPVPAEVRATADAPWHELLRVVIAAVRAGAGFTVSTPVGLPPAVRHALGEVGAVVFMESDEEWIDRMRGRDEPAIDDVETGSVARADRVRLVGAAASVAALHGALAVAVGGDPDLAIHSGDVTSAGRIELLPFLREQSISITAHRCGARDDWSAEVI